MPTASTQTDAQPLWKDIRFTDNGIIFTPFTECDYKSISDRLETDYPTDEWRWRLLGNVGSADCRVAVWKVARDDSEEEDDEEEEEDDE